MTPDDVMATLVRRIAEVVPDIDPARVRPGHTLAELGCNSIDRAEIVSLAMEELAVSVPIHEFRSGSDLETLAAIMHGYA